MKKVIIKIFIILCIITLVYSFANIIMWYVGIKRNESIQEEIIELMDEPTNENGEKRIDFTKLQEKNSEIVAYLKVNNTNIDYPVVKGNDNKFYLRHNLYKEYSHPGWIFVDYHNKLDGNDKNIVIYGHNNKDGSMFGTLKNVITEEWYENENNHLISLELPNEIRTYRVFSTYSVDVEDYYINTVFKNNSEFKKFINVVKGRSVYDYQVLVDENDSLLTLSTCTGNGKRRMVLHAKLENNIDNI